MWKLNGLEDKIMRKLETLQFVLSWLSGNEQATEAVGLFSAAAIL